MSGFTSQEIISCKSVIFSLVCLFFSCDVFRYYRFNEQTRSVDSGYPKPISTWSGAPDNIKAAIMSEDGCKFSSTIICNPALCVTDFWM